MKHFKYILGIILTFFVIILIVENHEAFSKQVVFRFDLFSIHLRSTNISMYYIVAISFLFGVLVSGLYGIIERFQLKREIRTLAATSKEKDDELNSLRNLPITSDNVGSGHVNGNDMDI